MEDNIEEMTVESLKNLDNIILYHGTIENRMKDILKDGLMPWGIVGEHNWYIDEDFLGIYVPKPNCVYLASFENAMHYANYISSEKGSRAIVLEVNVNTRKLVPDEDSRKNTWEESFYVNRTCAYVGKIEPQNFEALYEIKKKRSFKILDYKKEKVA